VDVLRFRWNGSELVDISGAPEIPLYVADSYLLSNGSVVAYQKHLERFSASALSQGLVRPIDDFLTAVTAKLPREGEYFPRVDLTERGELELRLRPAPSLTQTLTLATAPHDPRVEPSIKGPDIPALNELRAQAQSQGADDAVILDAKGQIVDGSTTCLMWFVDGELHVPPAEAIRVESVTVAVITEIARSQSIPVNYTWATPSQLSGTQLYALNALHGIKAVTSWVDGPELNVDLDALRKWRSHYAEFAERLPR
jgi:branched-subunit amino acid aminotransferase/4-amino-4-deoxychorismate lyase